VRKPNASETPQASASRKASVLPGSAYPYVLFNQDVGDDDGSRAAGGSRGFTILSMRRGIAERTAAQVCVLAPKAAGDDVVGGGTARQNVQNMSSLQHACAHGVLRGLEG